MITKRIIPCLDVKAGKVVKGVQFQDHEVVGDILERARFYSDNGADELVFYDITASCEHRSVAPEWITEVAKCIDIPFCVAGGIRSLNAAERVLQAGADKISINSPALENPSLINALASTFGTQCVVIGIDCLQKEDRYYVCRYTGDVKTLEITNRNVAEWIAEIQDRGAGEVVLNSMNQDGVRNGYALDLLQTMRAITYVPLIASGGAGKLEHFLDVFQIAQVDGALAASVFHKNILRLQDVKTFLQDHAVEVRLC